MQSMADVLQTAGFKSSLITSGEDVTFRGATIRVLIDRIAEADILARGEVALSPHQSSMVVVLATVSDTPPRIGEQFIDGNGQHHRIRWYQRTNIAHRCGCEMSGPP